MTEARHILFRKNSVILTRGRARLFILHLNSCDDDAAV